MSSPTSRSLQYLRKAGWTACVVEKWNRFAGVRQDAFGFGDILAVQKGKIALIQTTSAANVSARRKKILSLPAFARWTDAGGITVLHGWRKAGPRGKRKTWQLHSEILSPAIPTSNITVPVTVCPPAAAEGAETADDWSRLMIPARICACSHTDRQHRGPCQAMGCKCEKFVSP